VNVEILDVEVVDHGRLPAPRKPTEGLHCEDAQTAEEDDHADEGVQADGSGQEIVKDVHGPPLVERFSFPRMPPQRDEAR
jgi:hypothetical protein